MTLSNLSPRRLARKSLARNNRERSGGDRGAALVELGLAVPIFLILLAAIFDLGLAFNASRSTDETARSAARAAAAAGPSRLADLRAIDTVRAQYANSLEDVTWLTVYRSPVGGEGGVPDDCKPGGPGLVGTCNVYDATQIGTLVEANFITENCVGEPDENWCPTTRTEQGPNAPYLGVAIWVDHEPTLGFMLPDTEFSNDAVFRVETIEDFVPPEVVTPNPSVTAGTTTTPTVETSVTPEACGFNLYDNSNQAGWYLYVDAINEGNLGSGYNNDGSSFHVDGGCNVAVSTEYDGEGECQVLAAGSSDPDLQAPWRNSISWVDVDGSCPAIATATPASCAIALYDNSNFGGWSLTINDTNSHNLGAGYNNDASSFIVDTGCDVAVSTDVDGGGDCTILAAGTQNADLQAPWRNTISWVGLDNTCPAATPTPAPTNCKIWMWNGSISNWDLIDESNDETNLTGANDEYTYFLNETFDCDTAVYVDANAGGACTVLTQGQPVTQLPSTFYESISYIDVGGTCNGGSATPTPTTATPTPTPTTATPTPTPSNCKVELWSAAGGGWQLIDESNDETNLGASDNQYIYFQSQTSDCDTAVWVDASAGGACMMLPPGQGLTVLPTAFFLTISWVDVGGTCGGGSATPTPTPAPSNCSIEMWSASGSAWQHIDESNDETNLGANDNQYMYYQNTTADCDTAVWVNAPAGGACIILPQGQGFTVLPSAFFLTISWVDVGGDCTAGSATPTPTTVTPTPTPAPVNCKIWLWNGLLSSWDLIDESNDGNVGFLANDRYTHYLSEGFDCDTSVFTGQNGTGSCAVLPQGQPVTELPVGFTWSVSYVDVNHQCA